MISAKILGNFILKLKNKLFLSNLVISSQSLSLIKFLLDKILARLNKSEFLQKEWVSHQINIVDNDLKNHITEIYNKIISILLDR